MPSVRTPASVADVPQVRPRPDENVRRRDMKKLAKKAPKLCKDMLIRRLVKHVRKKNKDSAEEVRHIIQREENKD